MIAEGHLGKSCRGALAVKGIGGNDHAVADHFADPVIEFHNAFINRNIKIISFQAETDYFAAGNLKFRSDNILFFSHIHCKGYQCGRYIDIVEGSRHGILAADGREAVAYLCVKSAQ